MRVAVIGGGISGLAAAHALAEGGSEVVVLEAGDRLGGKIRTSDFAGRPVDEGADAFITRLPDALDLARRVGLGHDLMAPATGAASLWLDGGLKPIPPGLVLGVPVDLEPLAASGVLSPPGVDRARQEPEIPGLPIAHDVTVGALIRERYGPELHERLVDPLLGSINAGRTDELSLDVGAAPLAAAARSSRSLTEGLRRQRDASPHDPETPVFYAPRRGMGDLVDALASALAGYGVDLRLTSPVATIGRGGRRWLVGGEDGTCDDVDAVVMAAPAFVTSSLLRGLSPVASQALCRIRYASVALVTLAYPDDAIVRPPAGSGFLVPRAEGCLVTACSIFTNKWPHLGAGGHTVVRASVGRSDDERGVALDDEALVSRVHAELAEMVGLRAEPDAQRVSRWPRSFPQFPAGHLGDMAQLVGTLTKDAPGIVVAGAYLQGVGIPTCIRSARSAVSALAPT